MTGPEVVLLIFDLYLNGYLACSSILRYTIRY